MERLRRLDQASIASNVLQMFHSLRHEGNRAAHDGSGSQQGAFTQLKIARELAVWFQRSFGNDRRFDPGPFVPPRDLRADTAALESELAELRAVSRTRAQELEQARAAIDAEARRVLGIAEAEHKAREERELWETLALEAEAQHNADRRALEAAQGALEALQRRHEAEFVTLQTKAKESTPQVQTAMLEQTAQAAAAVDLDEAATRVLIDQQLRAAGWDVDTQELRYPAGSRPQKGKFLAMIIQS